jgi:hypothetical protein
MPVKRRKRKGRNFALTLDELWSLSLGENLHRPAFASDADRRAAWERHRDHMLMNSHSGDRPAAWWDYDSPERRKPRVEECRQLYDMAELTAHELAVLMERWREHYEQAQRPGYAYCIGCDGNTAAAWLEGEAAKKAQYRWAGIPPEIIKRWDAERRRRVEVIRKLEKAVV